MRDRSTAAADVVAGLTVAVVLLPQAVAYAQLAGVPAANGVVAAGVAALLGSAVGSSVHLQTGPTALAALLTLGVLSGLATPMSDRYIALAIALAVLVGIVRLALGLLRGGELSFVLSRPVLQGLAAGAGILIVASQLPPALGVQASAPNPLQAVTDVFGAAGIDAAAAVTAAVTLVVFVLTRWIRPTAPAALVAMLAGAAAGNGLGAPMVSAVSIAEVNFLDLSGLSESVALLVPAVVIGLVGFSEASAIARRYATVERVRWDANRELIGQGVAAIGSGLAGGPPPSGSFSRSALDRMAGGRTRWSGIVAGLAVLAVVPLLDLLRYLPVAALAGVVLIAGINLIDVAPFRTYWRNTRLQFAVAAGTLGATLVLAPRIDLAVLVGVGLALGAHTLREGRVHLTAVQRGDTLHIDLHGVLFFASAPAVADELGEIVADHADVDRVELHCRGLGRVDVTGALTLEEFVDELAEGGVEAQLVDVPPQARKVLQRIVGDIHPLG